MSTKKIDYSQYPDSSIPVYYSLKKGYLTYIGYIIPKHLSRKVYLMSPKQASEVLDLDLYKEFLDGDITKEGCFIHRDFGKKIDFIKINRAIQYNSSIKDERDIPSLFVDLVSHAIWVRKPKPLMVDDTLDSKNEVLSNSIIDPRFTTELGYRFDLDYD